MTEKDYVVLVDLRVKPETRKQIDLDEENDPIEDFKQGWKDAMTGNTLSASELWNLGDNEIQPIDELK